MATLLSKPAASIGDRSSFSCKGGLKLMRDIVVSTLCGGTAGLMMAVVGNAF
jgi:hypothetical protein